MDRWAVCPEHKGLKNSRWKKAGIFLKRDIARLPLGAVLGGHWGHVTRSAFLARVKLLNDKAHDSCHIRGFTVCQGLLPVLLSVALFNLLQPHSRAGDPHLTDEETEVQRLGTCPRSHGRLAGWDPSGASVLVSAAPPWSPENGVGCTMGSVIDLGQIIGPL